MILIDYGKCDSCGICVKTCPAGVFEMFEDEIVVANPQDCMICCGCVDACPRGAIVVEGCS